MPLLLELSPEVRPKSYGTFEKRAPCTFNHSIETLLHVA